VADRYQVWVEPFGLFSHDAELDLFEGLEDTVTSSIAAGPETTSVGEPIRLRDAAEWLAERSISQIDVLKLDTEGCEVPILGRLSAYVDSTAIIHVEYHSDADRRAIDCMLEGTHALVNANVRQINRGELTYVLRAALPPGRLEQGAITLPASLDQPAYDVRPVELSAAASGSHRG
jgi:hypothetical protein